MTIEQIANKAETTLDGAINNAVTTILVSDPTAFPSSADFRILIDSEIMKVSAVDAVTPAQWTVERGMEGTTAASHSDSATVTHVLTVASLRAQADGILADDESAGSSFSVQYLGETSGTTNTEIFLGGITNKRLEVPDNTTLFLQLEAVVGKGTNSDNQWYGYGHAYFDNDGATTVMHGYSQGTHYSTTTAANISFGVTGDYATVWISGVIGRNITWNIKGRVTQTTAIYNPGNTGT